MEKRGYTWKLNRKYISLKAPGMERYIRLRSLGKNYSEEEIRGQILQPKVKRVGTTSRKRTHKIDKFLNFNALNNNYSHIDLAIHNRNGYGFVLCCRMFQYIRNTNHMHDHNHKSKYDLTILF